MCGHLSAGKTEAFGKNPTEKSAARGANITGLYHTCFCLYMCDVLVGKFSDLVAKIPNSSTHGNHPVL